MGRALSVIMPCYNEATGMQRHTEEMLKYLEKLTLPYELILVNDGSTDRTASILDNLAAQYPRVKVVHHNRNLGRGAALRTGFAAANNDFVFTFDADLTYAPNHLETMLRALEEQKADIVMGSPYHKGGTATNVPGFRLLISRLGNKVLTMSSPFTVMTCVLRGYRKEALDSLALFADGKEIHLEIISKAQDLNLKIVEVPAHLHWHEKAGKHVGRRSTFKLVGQSIVHLQYLFSETPFLILGVIASVLILCGFGIGVFMVSEWLNHRLVPDRPLVTLMVILLIAGLQTLLFSLIANQNRSLRRDLIQTQSLIKKK